MSDIEITGEGFEPEDIGEGDITVTPGGGVPGPQDIVPLFIVYMRQAEGA